MGVILQFSIEWENADDCPVREQGKSKYQGQPTQVSCIETSTGQA